MAKQETSIAKRVYDKLSKDDRSILKMVVDFFSKEANQDKSIAKVIVDFLSNTPNATVTKSDLIKVANQAKSAVRDSKVETKDKPLDLSIPKRLPKKEEAAFQKDVKNIRKSKRPLKEVTVGTAQFQKKAVEPPKGTSESWKKLNKPVVSIKKTDAPHMIKTDNTDNGPKVNPKSTAPVKHIQELRKVMDDKGGKFGEKAGRKAIQNFFKDTFGIKDIEVDYTFPGEEGYGTPPEDRPKKTQSKKSGGKVTAKQTPTKRAAVKRPTTKKYAMNRGGKVASVRKPTRA
jgi:hypothetical protein